MILSIYYSLNIPLFSPLSACCDKIGVGQGPKTPYDVNGLYTSKSRNNTHLLSCSHNNTEVIGEINSEVRKGQNIKDGAMVFESFNLWWSLLVLYQIHPSSLYCSIMASPS